MQYKILNENIRDVQHKLSSLLLSLSEIENKVLIFSDNKTYKD